MTDEEMAGWNLANWQARLSLVYSTPCEDCTTEFAKEQRGLGLCNGFPGAQRYCARCARWWPDDKRHWLPSDREAFACRVCRKRRQNARSYRRRYRRNAAFRAGELTRSQLRYQQNRTAILTRNRAARAKT